MEYLLTVLYVLVTCMLAVCQQTLQDVTPVFTREPTSQIVRRGRRVKLRCAFQPTEGDVRWFVNGTLLGTLMLELSDMSINNGNLIIETFRGGEDDLFTHVGGYQCQVTTGVGTILSRTASLQLPVIEDFEKRSTLEVRAPRGGEAVIPCEAPESLPAADLSYRKDGDPVPSHSDHYLVLPSGHLHIVNVTAADSGNYSCRAENPISRVMVSHGAAIPLRVETEFFQSDVRPIIQYTNGHAVNRGQTAMLECVCIGRPLPRIRWERVDGDFPERTSQHGGTLVIEDVAVKDAGTYRCIAENGVEDGASSAEVELTVIKAPSIKNPPSNVEVVPGDTATFQCIVGRASVAEPVRWFFNGRLLSADKDKYTVGDTELVVRDVTMEDLGMYQCFTIEGTVQAAARMRLDDGFPQIIGIPQDTAAIEGEMVTMVCEIQGSPFPTVGWTDGQGSKVISSERVKVTEDITDSLFIARLMIINVGQQDIGDYTCIAYNKLGRASRTATLFVIPLSDLSTTTQGDKTILNPPNHGIASDAAMPTDSRDYDPIILAKPGVPAKPTKPMLYKVAETSVMVRWNHTQSPLAPLVGFKVEYIPVLSNVSGWTTIPEMIPPHQTYYTVQYLDETVIYRFQVLAIGLNNMTSTSEVSNRYILHYDAAWYTPPTPRPFTPSPPRLTRCTAMGTDRIRINWEYVPMIIEGPIAGFYIYLRLTDSDDDRDYVRKPIIGADVRTYVIDKLEPEVSYDIKMSTFTNSRESEFSNVWIRNTLARHTPPPSIFVATPNPRDRFPLLPTAKPADDERSDLMYLILGIVLGAMMLLMTLFIVMCFWRSKQMRGDVKMMRYIPADLQQTMYGGSYPFAATKTHNGSLPHFSETDGGPSYKSRKSQSTSQLMWTETRPLYTMPQDTLSKGSTILPYKTIPSEAMNMYSPLHSPCTETETEETPLTGDPPVATGELQGNANGSIPSLGNISHNSLGPRPVCRIKHCRIPEDEELGESPLLFPGRPSCSGDDSETGSLPFKLNMEGYVRPRPSTRELSPPLSPPPPDDDHASNCSRPRSSSNQSNASSHQSNHHSDSSHVSSHRSFPVSVHSNSSVVTDV